MMTSEKSESHNFFGNNTKNMLKISFFFSKQIEKMSEHKTCIFFPFLNLSANVLTKWVEFHWNCRQTLLKQRAKSLYLFPFSEFICKRPYQKILNFFEIVGIPCWSREPKARASAVAQSRLEPSVSLCTRRSQWFLLIVGWTFYMK